MPGVVQVSCLNPKHGRYGNSLFIAAFARKYAELHNAQLQVPADWAGRRVFEGWDAFPPITDHYPRTGSDQVPWGKVNIDLFGYFQNQLSIQHLRRSELRRWFTVQKRWLDRYPPPSPDAVVAHVRRGDYVGLSKKHYALLHEECYLDGLKQCGYDPARIWWIREDRPQNDPAAEAEGVPFLPDFLTLMQASVLFRANSTFSWWAGTLGTGKVYSPVVDDKIGTLVSVPWVPSNHPRCADNSRIPGSPLTDLWLAE